MVDPFQTQNNNSARRNNTKTSVFAPRILHVTITMAAQVNLLQHGLVDEKLSGDVVGWCPATDFQHYFVIGCYYQHQGAREGKLLLFKYQDAPATLIQSVPTSAVLDLKWRDRDLLVATAEGTAQWRIESASSTAETSSAPTSQPDARLVPVQQWPLASLALYLSLHRDTHVVTSTEQGTLLARALEQGSVTWQVQAHEYSAWCVQCVPQSDLLLSGGDDCALRLWDLRCPAAVQSITKHYTMGVTDIACLPWEHTLAVGSYDESVKLWDLRALRQPTAHYQLGGGVWRIRHARNSQMSGSTGTDCTQQNLVLAVGCATNHFKLMQLTSQALNQLVEHRHADLQATPQDTLAYGIDWCRAVPDLYVTCSFYDKIYSVWSATCK